jgi:hypothetical protein
MAQSNIKLSTTDGVDNEDLMNVLRFQDIHVAKVKLSGDVLPAKNFSIHIRDFVNGKLSQTHTIFESKDDDFFKIKDKDLRFTVLAKRTADNKARIDFRFHGFSASHEFSLKNDQKDFILKGFQRGEEEVDITSNTNHAILTFMMPYKTKNGIAHYCDVIQDEIAPEELGKRFNIPRYFLIDIQFE